MNYHFGRPIEYTAIRIIFGPTRWYFAYKGWIFSSFSTKVFDSDHKLNLKEFWYFLIEDILKVFYIFLCLFIINVKYFIHYGLGHMEIGLIN